MAWVKLDDSMAENGKIIPLSDRAFRAYVEGILYAGRNGTNGFIPMRTVRNLASGRIVRELAQPRRPRPDKEPSSLWEPVDGGFMIHDFLDYNPTRADVAEKRVKSHAAKSRAGKAGSTTRWQNS